MARIAVPSPAGRGTRSVPSSMSMLSLRQRARIRRPASSAPARCNGACTAAAARSAPLRPRSMSGSSSLMRTAASSPLRAMRHASSPTISRGARSSALPAPGPAHAQLAEAHLEAGFVTDQLLECGALLRHTRRDQLVGEDHREQQQQHAAERDQRDAQLRFTDVHALHEYDVVMIHAVEGLDLQADRPADLRLEFAQGGGLLIEEAIHDVLMREYQQLATGKLSALSHNFAKYLVADRFRGPHESAPLAASTRFTQQVFQALAGTLARHFHQA